MNALDFAQMLLSVNRIDACDHRCCLRGGRIGCL